MKDSIEERYESFTMENHGLSQHLDSMASDLAQVRRAEADLIHENVRLLQELEDSRSQAKLAAKKNQPPQPTPVGHLRRWEKQGIGHFWCMKQCQRHL